MKKYRNGLIVGKFSPLHKGHESVVNRALEDCENLYIFSYSNPEFPGCEARKREIWLKTLFPEAKVFVITSDYLKARWNFTLPANDADDLTHRRLVGFLWLELAGEPLDAVFTSESYGAGFAEELSRYFAFYTNFPAVKHELVDAERKQIPISGTTLRRSVHEYKHFLSSEVYVSFVENVCFLGGESTGKSTLAELLAAAFATSFVPEYGRTLWEEKRGNLVFEDLLKIAKIHVRQEDAALKKAHKYLFVDTSPLTTLLYSLHLFGRADPELVWLSQRKYNFTFLCAPDFSFVQDGTRADGHFRERQHAEYLNILAQRKIKYTLLEGNLVERAETVRAVLSNAR